jgi:hypothetical protein
MIPSEVWAVCRKIAMNRRRPMSWVDASIVVLILFLFVSFAVISTRWVMKDWNLVLGQWLKWFARMKLISESNAR